jgi:hypothetical protein
MVGAIIGCYRLHAVALRFLNRKIHTGFIRSVTIPSFPSTLICRTGNDSKIFSQNFQPYKAFLPDPEPLPRDRLAFSVGRGNQRWITCLCEVCQVYVRLCVDLLTRKPVTRKKSDVGL